MKNIRSKGRFIPAIFFGLVLLVLAGITGCEIGKPGSEGFTKAETGNGLLGGGINKGFYLDSSLWNNTNLTVCWENADANNATERGWVRAAIDRTWTTSSALQFTGWGQCNGNGANIRIRVEDVVPHTQVLGNQLNNRVDGMSLNFTYNNWGCRDANNNWTPCNLTAATRQRWIESNGIHEFGHALGMAHEQARPENFDGSLCNQFQGGSYNDETQGDIPVGNYDNDSIMHYCFNSSYNNALSDGDVDTIVQMYGPNGFVPLPNDGHTISLTGDFDGDGQMETAWRRTGWGSWRINFRNGVVAWLADGISNDFIVNDGHQVHLIGDFDGDGRDDIAWRRTLWGSWRVSYGNNTPAWLADGRSNDFFVNDGHQVHYTGDFDNDGRDDIAWRRTGWGSTRVSYGNGTVGYI
ncbi:MAG: hypothetical protein GY765_38035 [bacterium]|nr:hypothetical protein [bacterium]